MTNGKKCEKYLFKIDRLRALLRSVFFAACIFRLCVSERSAKRHGHFVSFLYFTPCISCSPHCARCSKAQPTEFIIKILEEKLPSACGLVNERNNNDFNGQFTLLQSKACHWYGPISRMWLIAASQPISEKMMLQLDDFLHVMWMAARGPFFFDTLMSEVLKLLNPSSFSAFLLPCRALAIRRKLPNFNHQFYSLKK